MMTRGQAAERLKVSGVTDAEPQVPQDVYLSFLDSTARASIHAASTAYAYNVRVIPSAANGRIYKCVIAGTSDATLPSWPAYNRTRQGQKVTDGSVTWEDCGAAHAELYDLNAASRECWLWRAQQLSQKTDTTSDGLTIKRSQLYDHALAQAKRYGWRGAL